MQKIGDVTGTADVNGEFTEGDAQTPATQIKAQWLNTIQRELVGLVEGAGIALDPMDDTQVYAAAQAIIAGGTMFQGFVNAAADAPSLPGGWSVAKTDNGVYQVTHNLGLAEITSLRVVATVSGSLSGSAFISSLGINSFEVSTFRPVNVNTDLDWFFMAVST